MCLFSINFTELKNINKQKESYGILATFLAKFHTVRRTETCAKLQSKIVTLKQCH